VSVSVRVAVLPAVVLMVGLLEALYSGAIEHNSA
jgi:hypothetical protein